MTFLAGKKTAIAAGGIVLIGVVALLFGGATPVQASTLIAVGLAIFGLGDKAERYGAQILAALIELQRVQAEVKAGQKVDVVHELKFAASEIPPQLLLEALQKLAARSPGSAAAAGATQIAGAFAAVDAVAGPGVLNVGGKPVAFSIGGTGEQERK